jgi:hypothetical protein
MTKAEQTAELKALIKEAKELLVSKESKAEGKSTK